MKALIDTLGFVVRHPLNKVRPVRAVLRFADWQMRSRLYDEITVPWVNDTKLVVRRGMTGATGNIYAGLHEFADMAFVLHFLRPTDTFIDVGANVGSYTVLASGAIGARSVAIEPDPTTVSALQRNVDANNIGDKVTICAVAVGAESGELAFTVGLDTMNRAAHAGDRAARHVRQERLDTVTFDVAPALIKMDVEGFEEHVFRGMPLTLAKQALKAVLIETVSNEILAALLSAGFERAHYDPFTRSLGAQAVAPDGNNALFVRDRVFVIDRLRSAKPFRVLEHVI